MKNFSKSRKAQKLRRGLEVKKHLHNEDLQEGKRGEGDYEFLKMKKGNNEKDL